MDPLFDSSWPNNENIARNDQIHIYESTINAPVSTSPIVVHYHNQPQTPQMVATETEKIEELPVGANPFHMVIWRFVQAIPWKTIFWICQIGLLLFFLQVLYVQSCIR